MDGDDPHCEIYVLLKSSNYFFNPKIQTRKILISYYKCDGIITLKKHVYAKKSIISKRFGKEVNNPLEEFFLKKIYKKKGQMYLNHQYEKNWCKRSLKKDAKCIIKNF
jgi:hypothetical protein